MAHFGPLCATNYCNFWFQVEGTWYLYRQKTSDPRTVNPVYGYHIIGKTVAPSRDPTDQAATNIGYYYANLTEKTCSGFFWGGFVSTDGVFDGESVILNSAPLPGKLSLGLDYWVFLIHQTFLFHLTQFILNIFVTHDLRTNNLGGGVTKQKVFFEAEMSRMTR